jgi:hypothetical protein
MICDLKFKNKFRSDTFYLHLIWSIEGVVKNEGVALSLTVSLTTNQKKEGGQGVGTVCRSV